MKVTLKTKVTYPRHGNTTHEAGATIDVPDKVGTDWIERGVAEPLGAFTSTTETPKDEPKAKR